MDLKPSSSVIYEGNEPYIFISYSHKDQKALASVKSVLIENNIRFWYDDGLHSGNDWNMVIAKHLNNATACLLLLSSNSAESEYVKNELIFAENHKIPIHPLLVQSFVFPLDIEMILGRKQIIEMTEDYSRELLKGLPIETFINESDFIIECGTLKEYCGSSVEVIVPRSVKYIGDSSFSRCTTLIYAKIPESVVSIGSDAFFSCTNLISITLPEGVTSIGDSAFGWCTRLESITIPNSVTKIGNGTFALCENLTSVTIGSSVTSIGESAFTWCSRLTSITIPDSVTSIDLNAFKDCPNLKDVTISYDLLLKSKDAFDEELYEELLKSSSH